MATEQLYGAMIRLAESLRRRELNHFERSQLEREFERATGSAAERATKAIAITVGLPERDITTKAAVYDDIGRLLDEVQIQADEYREQAENVSESSPS